MPQAGRNLGTDPSKHGGGRLDETKSLQQGR
jgi:hypothetical protein